jgi:Skp family chaperone for outer membrane proteins
MKKNWRIYTFHVAIVSLLLVGYVTAQNVAPKTKASVAVVDIKKLFDSLEQKKQAEADMQAQQAKLNLELATKKDAIAKIKTELGVLPLGSAPYKSKQEMYELKTLELQAWASLQQRKVKRANVMQTEGLYKRMLKSIEVIGKSGAYDLVLYKERPLNLAGIKAEQISAVLQSRKVVYAAERLDITDMVIRKMNNDWKNKK